MAGMGERRGLQAPERDRFHVRVSSAATRRSGSSPSAGHRSTSSGHQANASCSSSGVTVDPFGQPCLADRASRSGWAAARAPRPAAAAPAPTIPRAAPGRACPPGSRRSRPIRRPRAPIAPPRTPASSPGGRPATLRRRPARRTAPTCFARRTPGSSRSAQRAGCSSSVSPPTSDSKSTSLASESVVTRRAALAQRVERHVGGLGGAGRRLERVRVPAHVDLLWLPRTAGEDGRPMSTRTHGSDPARPASEAATVSRVSSGD